MHSGYQCGTPHKTLLLDWFVEDDGGYTSLSVVVALLLALIMLFSTATVVWVSARAAHIQRVADAGALAGARVISAYSSVVQIVDGCVVSMGLAGVASYGAGLALACIPGCGALGTKVTDTASSILRMRQRFARTAARGLEQFEHVLPALIIANSSSCISANSTESHAYYGCSVPFPQQSQSQFDGLQVDFDDSEMKEQTQSLAEHSDALQDLQEEIDTAKREAYHADSENDPFCLEQRAAHLAGLTPNENPHYPSIETWTFGVSILRARAYYAKRLATVAPLQNTHEAVVDSMCRREFYRYAVQQLQQAYYRELPDHTVELYMPDLPRNTDEMKQTSLYTSPLWPVSSEEGRRVLHATDACPRLTQATGMYASLQDLDTHRVHECDLCGLTTSKFGRVAQASTAINNGFEFYYRKVVEASKRYAPALAQLRKQEDALYEQARHSSQSFQEALNQLSVARPRICPPGAWGCIAVVGRSEGSETPEGLRAGLILAEHLPFGVAFSGATLAPQDREGNETVLAHFFDHMSQSEHIAGVLMDGVMELWSRVLMGYQSGYEQIGSIAGDFLDGFDRISGGTVGHWLKEQFKQMMHDIGLDPPDLRMRKPVLVHTSYITNQAGVSRLDQFRSVVRKLSSTASLKEVAQAFGIELLADAFDEEIVIAELSMGEGLPSIPFSISIGSLLRKIPT